MSLILLGKRKLKKHTQDERALSLGQGQDLGRVPIACTDV